MFLGKFRGIFNFLVQKFDSGQLFAIFRGNLRCVQSQFDKKSRERDLLIAVISDSCPFLTLLKHGKENI